MRKIKSNLRVEYVKLKHKYLGQVVQNLRLASVSYNPDIYIEQAIQNVLDLKTATASLSDFEEFTKEKLFYNPETKNEVRFNSLPLEEQKKIRLKFRSQYESKSENKSIAENIVDLMKGLKGASKKIAEKVMSVPSATRDFFTDPKKRKEMIKTSLEGAKNLSSKAIKKGVAYLKEEFAVEEFKTAFSLFKKDPTNGEETFIDDDGNEIGFEELSDKEKYRWREKKAREVLPKIIKASTKIAGIVAFGAFAYKAGGLIGVASATASKAKADLVGKFSVQKMVEDTAKKSCQKALGLNPDEMESALSLLGDKKDDDKKDDDKKDDDKKDDDKKDDKKSQGYNPLESGYFNFPYEDIEEEIKKIEILNQEDEEEEDEEADEEEDEDEEVNWRGEKEEEILKRKKEKQKEKQKLIRKAKEDKEDKTYNNFIDHVRREFMYTMVDKKWHSKEFFEEAVTFASKKK
jgi:hypothetical protein